MREPSAIPQTLQLLALYVEEERGDLHGVGGPEDESVACNGKEERSDLLAPGVCLGAAVDSQVPYDDEEGDARDCIPSPLLRCALAAESGEETSEDHDDVGDDGHEDVGTVETSEQTEIKEEERSGQSPVDIASPEDLAFDRGEGVGNVVILVTDDGLVDRDTVAGSHGKVGDGGEDQDESGDDMVETALDGNPPGQSGEASRGNHHGHEDDPESLLSTIAHKLLVDLRTGNDSRQRRHGRSCGCGDGGSQRGDERGGKRNWKDAVRLHRVDGFDHHDGGGMGR